MSLLRIVFISVWLVCSTAHASNLLAGFVVAVSDGDTITVLDAEKRQHKVRLAAIDAPEKAQAFGERSKISLSRLLFNKDVCVEWDKFDR